MRGDLRGVIPIKTILCELGAYENLLIDINEREFEDNLLIFGLQKLYLNILDGGETPADQGVESWHGLDFKAGILIFVVLNNTCGGWHVSFEC